MRTVLCTLFFAWLGIVPASAQQQGPVSAPVRQVGDTCEFQQRNWSKEMPAVSEVVNQVAADGSVVLNRLDRETKQLLGQTWLNAQGEIVAVSSGDGPKVVYTNPKAQFSYPLQEGKSWVVSYGFPYRADSVTLSPGIKQVEMTATVKGWKTVTVPAGTFSAIHVTYEGKYTDVPDPGAAGRGGSGSYNEEAWYSPEHQCLVKFVRNTTTWAGKQSIRFEQQLIASGRPGS